MAKKPDLAELLEAADVAALNQVNQIAASRLHSVPVTIMDWEPHPQRCSRWKASPTVR
jgi:hypothetical protein